MLQCVCSHYLEARSLNEGEYQDRRYIEEYRNDNCEGYIHRHYHRDFENYRIHCSKSSVHSRRSSPKRKRNRHCSSHQSRSVWLTIFFFWVDTYLYVKALNEPINLEKFICNTIWIYYNCVYIIWILKGNLQILITDLYLLASLRLPTFTCFLQSRPWVPWF